LFAQVDGKRETQSAFSPDEVGRALSRILTSKYFINAPKKQKFLRLVCDFYVNGRAGDLNEYLIGREVFDRDDSYNPSVDPIVRVGAHDVRKKLELYYKTDGQQDEIKLDIPVGGYGPLFSRSIRSEPAQTLDEAPAEREAPLANAAPSGIPVVEVASEHPVARSQTPLRSQNLLILIGVLGIVSLGCWAG